MKLIDIRLGVPLLRLETRISHVTPRKPTAFERVILAMVDRFAENASFNAIPINRLFAEMLSVPAPEPLLTPTLENLTSLDVIRCTADIRFTDKLALGQLELTERGRHMIVHDLLPARTASNDEIFLFDPIAGRLLSDAEGAAYRPAQPGQALDASLFADLFPDELIRERIRTGRFRWFGASSQIEHVRRLATTVLWKEAPCWLEIESGVLHLRSRDTVLDDYLASSESTDAYARLIAPLLDTALPEVERLPVLPPEEVGRGAEVFTVTQAMQDWPANSRFVIPGNRLADDDLPAQAAPHQVILLPVGAGSPDALSIEWNDTEDGCTIRFAAEHPAPDVLLVADRELLQGLRTAARYGDEVHEIVLVRRTPARQAFDTYRPMFDALESQLASSGDERAGHLGVLWQGERHFLAERLEELACASVEPDQLAAAFLATLEHAEKLLGKLDRDAWLDGLSAVLIERIAGNAEFPVESCRKLIATLAERPRRPGTKIRELLQVMEGRLRAPETLQGLKELTTLFAQVDPAWSPADPSRLLGAGVVQDLVQRFPLPLAGLAPFESLPVVKSLRDLLALHANLEAAVGPGGLSALTDNRSVRLLRSEVAPRLTNAAQAWQRGVQALMPCLPEGVTLEGTQLAGINGKVNALAVSASRLIVSLAPDIRKVYVFDTPVLLAEPSIVEEIRPGELLVFGKRVIDELEDKKRDAALRPLVAAAVNRLRELDKHRQLHFQDGAVSLLSPDYRDQGDNRILSVAVRYRRYKPVLVTNDDKLAVAAQVEEVDTMSADDFLERPRPGAGRERRTDLPVPDKHAKNKRRKG